MACHRYRSSRGVDYCHRLWAFPVDCHISGGVLWFIRPGEEKIKQDASVGLLSETAIVLPLALGYWIYLGIAGQTTAWTLPPTMFFELLLSGVVTALPLLFFARAAARYVAVYAQVCSVYRSNHHADSKHICV